MSQDQGSENSSVNQEVNVSIETQNRNPSLFVRAIYFLLIGWWLAGIWLSVAWLFNVTIVLMPVGIKMINKTPKVLSLKEQGIENEVMEKDGNVTVRQNNKEQHSLLLRGVYFLLVGWWASGILMGLAWLASITIIGLPLAIWLYGKLPYVVSLYRY